MRRRLARRRARPAYQTPTHVSAVPRLVPTVLLPKDPKDRLSRCLLVNTTRLLRAVVQSIIRYK